MQALKVIVDSDCWTQTVRDLPNPEKKSVNFRVDHALCANDGQWTQTLKFTDPIGNELSGHTENQKNVKDYPQKSRKNWQNHANLEKS